MNSQTDQVRNQQKPYPPQRESHQQIRRSYLQRQFAPRYQNIFYGYYYSCTNFGHKDANYRAYLRNNQIRDNRNESLQSARNRDNRFVNSYTNDPKDNNPFAPLFDYIECYNCHNHGHKAADCRTNKIILALEIKQAQEELKTWKKKRAERKEECGIILYAQNHGNHWYVDSGFSKHMTGDKSKFLSWREDKIDNVTFGNDALGKIMGKDTISLNDGRGRAQNVLFVDGLKHNLLSANQLCDQGYDVTVHSKGSEIKTTSTKKATTKVMIAPSNVYIINEENEKCCLGKLDESWLWHKRLRHLNFVE